ncbi:MAG: asparagine--tRNA ligase [Peptoniphilaceae bacterium]|nr:asparagine--tRNA ligase [Peptoniphilaceae bacterium]MDD7383589.1 asparagine--tRNA ligase [Peptoniphilaceae bacterium]MDY3738761.1 asparagine--tRNA ligase [Peptoniphilaceae bacterium]
MEIKELFQKQDELNEKEVEISGWIRQSRFSKNVGFIELNDGSDFKNIQVVVSKELENFVEISKAYLSTSLKIKGKFVITPKAKQPFEIQANFVEILGESDDTFPVQKKELSLEYLRTIPHLRVRTNTFRSVFKVRSTLAFAIHKFFQEKGFVYVNTPIVTSSDAEGAGEMFTITTLTDDNLPLKEDGKIDYSKDFFSKHSHLTVSGQLEAEDFAMAFGKVYTFGPTFRAEDSNTPRHAAEFWMVEPEIAFADLSDVMDSGEEMLKSIISYVLENCKDEIEYLNNNVDPSLIERLEFVRDSKFSRISYTDAINYLKDAKVDFEFPVEWGMDLQTEHERYISEQIVKGPCFVTDYPKEIKAFYMRRNDDGKTVAAADLLVPGVGELIGASQREERLDVLKDILKEKGMNEEEYKNYLDLRRFGSVKHGGYGLGFERAVMYLTGIKNIRDSIPYPRTVNQFSKKN